MEQWYRSLVDLIHNVFIPIVLIFSMERKHPVWLIVFLLLSGCIGQKSTIDTSTPYPTESPLQI
jgi:hypothetical protein